MSLIARFGINKEGKDWCVGDLHGTRSRLMEALTVIGFDFTKDRLFSVGDLVDRGAESVESLLLVDEPWFFAVLGNHDYFLVQYHTGSENLKPRHYAQMGGAWAMGLTKEERQLYVDRVTYLPILIEVETARGKVGIVHADVLNSDWDATAAWLEKNPVVTERHWPLFWSRVRQDNQHTIPVKGVVTMVVGHTPNRNPVRLANVIMIDTYGWKDIKEYATPTFTLYNLADDECVLCTWSPG